MDIRLHPWTRWKSSMFGSRQTTEETLDLWKGTRCVKVLGMSTNLFFTLGSSAPNFWHQRMDTPRLRPILQGAFLSYPLLSLSGVPQAKGKLEFKIPQEKMVLLMVQKSGDHQLRLVVYPLIDPRWPGGAGFLPSTAWSWPIEIYDQLGVLVRSYICLIQRCLKTPTTPLCPHITPHTVDGRNPAPPDLYETRNLVNNGMFAISNGMFAISTGAGFLPSTSYDPRRPQGTHQDVDRKRHAQWGKDPQPGPERAFGYTHRAHGAKRDRHEITTRLKKKQRGLCEGMDPVLRGSSQLLTMIIDYQPLTSHGMILQVQFVLLSFLQVFFLSFTDAIDIAPMGQVSSLSEQRTRPNAETPTMNPTKNHMPYSCQRGNLQIRRSNNGKRFFNLRRVEPQASNPFNMRGLWSCHDISWNI